MTTLHDLSDMQYDFVSLVDYPANQAARVTLAKRDVRKAGKVDPDDEGYEGDGESNPSKAGETTRAKMLSRTSKATSRVRPAPAGSPDDDPVTDGEDDEDELEKRGGKLSRDENGLEGDDDNEHNEQPADARPNPNLNKRADQVVISKADFEALRKGLERAEARAAAA